MSIASAIQAKQQQVADSYSAISNKGGTLPETQNLTNLATAISSIPSGGGGESVSDWLSRVLNGDTVTGANDYDSLGGTATIFKPANATGQSGLSSLVLPEVEYMSAVLNLRYWNRISSIIMPKLKYCRSAIFSGTSSYQNSLITSLEFPSLVSCNNEYNIIQYMKALRILKLNSFTDYNFSLYLTNNCPALEYLYMPALRKINKYLAYTTGGALRLLYFRDLEEINDSPASTQHSLDKIVLAGNHIVRLAHSDLISTMGNKFTFGEGEIFVPDNLVDDYKTTQNWSDLANMIKPLSSFINPYE